ncbi:MAG: AraC family transcriptional regulator [Pseudomonadales bacterium]|nr:AraC family transcriptional regulator [Halioglobus sp.]MCP5123298.1 AraC family transcriptional regulator [Pseudomonadales bacterium]MCP5192948.1 AraC family transcriptional regulator [Pseudomonadales bacterium]
MKSTATGDHSLLGSFIVPVAQALRQQGVDPLAVAEDVGIDLARGANPDWRVGQRDFARLLDHCVAATGDEAFGLLAAEQLQPQVLHSLGLAWLASDTVYDGLVRLQRFGRLVSTGIVLRLEEEGDYIHLHLGMNPRENEVVYATHDYAVGIVTRMCRLTLGEFLAPMKLVMQRPVPREPQRWEYLLSSRVEFGADSTRITWSRSDILEPLVTGDPLLARINDEHTQTYLSSFIARTATRDVVDKIVERLPDGPPGQQQIASALHMSNRTLQRKLREEGTSFKDLLQDTRMQLARKYLLSPGRSVVETAYLLGFSEPSTFSRAFKRWTGVAPADYREAQKDAAHLAAGSRP